MWLKNPIGQSKLHLPVPSRLSLSSIWVSAVERLIVETGQHREGLQMSFFQLDDPVLCQIRDQLLSIDVNNLTPIEALNKLNDIKKILKGK